MTTEPFEGQLTVTERLSLAVATVERLRKSVEERDRRIAELAQALLDSADEVDAVVSAAVAARVAAIRARVEDLDTTPGTVEGVLHSDYRPHLIPVVRVVLDDVLSAIDAIGGAP